MDALIFSLKLPKKCPPMPIVVRAQLIVQPRWRFGIMNNFSIDPPDLLHREQAARVSISGRPLGKRKSSLDEALNKTPKP